MARDKTQLLGYDCEMHVEFMNGKLFKIWASEWGGAQDTDTVGFSFIAALNNYQRHPYTSAL